MTRPTIADLPPRHQAEVARQLNAGKPIGQARAKAVRQVECVPGKKRIRQRAGDGMNKWEREYLARLRADCTCDHIYREVSLPLANGVRYKVDFLVAYADVCGSKWVCVRAYEVKGHMRDDAAVKLKVAASVYPWIKFFLAYKVRGNWRTQEVLA